MTASTSAAFSPAFHDDDPAQTTEYRSLSVLAVISLVFGVVSWVSLFFPLLIVVPLFGIAISILALRQISTNPSVFTGRTAALIGLMLCIASLVAPTSRDVIFRAMRTSQAKKISREFLSFVTAGKLEDAFRQTYEGSRPKPTPPADPGAAPSGPGTGPSKSPATPSPPTATPLETFSAQPLIGQLKAIGPDAKIRFLGTDSYEPFTFRNITLKQRYAVTRASGGEPVEVILTLQRTQVRGESMSRWLVVHVDDAKAAPAPSPDQQNAAASS
jgi:hypothetical protein